jgi:hypothetical protein
MRPPQAPSSMAPKNSEAAKSTSATKQFIIHGADLHTRSAFSLLSEDVSGSLGRLLRDDARFSVPIVVDLHTAPDVSTTAPTVAIDMSVVENSVFHFGLIVQLRADFRTDDYTRELVRVLLVERILRDHPQVQSARRPILPDWVATGVMQALEFRGRSRPSALFAAVFRSGQFYSVEKIFTVNPSTLDALSRTIFDTSSCALVLALLDQPDGSLRFAKFLSALATDSKTDRELLQQAFPNFSTSKNSLEKWWTLQMATLATPNALETMSIEDTEAKLTSALTLRFEETPEEAAKAEKKSGGFLGLFSGSKPKDKTTEEVIKTAPEPQAKKTESKEAPEKKSVITTEEKPARGGLLGLFSSNKAKDKSESEIKSISAKEEAKTPEKPRETAAKSKPAKKVELPPEDENKPKSGGFFKGLFGGKSEIKEADTEKKSEKTAPPQKEKKDKSAESEEKPAAQNTFFGGRKVALPLPQCEIDNEVLNGTSCAPSAEEHPAPSLPKNSRRASDRPANLPKESADKNAEVEKKPSRLNPMNWFNKSDKKPGEDKPKGAAAVENKNPTAKAPESKPAPAIATVENYQRIWQRKDRSEILKRSLDQLNTLKVRAHPLYRSLVVGYIEQLQKLMEGKDKGVSDKLESLGKRRAEVHELARALESHLDWYEATQVQTRSGLFDDYLKLREKLDKEVRPRTDEISKYLDSLAKEYED